MTITCKVETITPEIAAKWLKLNICNYRRIDKSRLKNYTEEMITGNWELTGETIIFREDGSLSNGQTRLSAIVASGATIRSLVARGITASAFHVDRGKPRNVAQWLSHEGVPNAALVAAASRMCIAHHKGLWARGGWGRDTMTDTEIAEYAFSHHENLIIASTYTRFEGLSAAMIASVLYLGSGEARADENETAKWFRDGLVEGTDLQDTDAVLHLRNKALKQTKGDRMTSYMARMMVTIAWNKTVKGDPCSGLGLRLILSGPTKQVPPKEVFIADGRVYP